MNHNRREVFLDGLWLRLGRAVNAPEVYRKAIVEYLTETLSDGASIA